MSLLNIELILACILAVFAVIMWLIQEKRRIDTMARRSQREIDEFVRCRFFWFLGKMEIKEAKYRSLPYR